MCQSLHPVSLPIQRGTSHGWMAGTSALIVFLFFVLSIKEGFNLKQLSFFFSKCPGALCFSDLQVFSYYWKLYSFLLVAASSSQSFSLFFFFFSNALFLCSWIPLDFLILLISWDHPFLTPLWKREHPYACSVFPVWTRTAFWFIEFFVHIFSSFLCCWKRVMHFEFWKNRLARGINVKARFLNKISLWQQ